MSDTPRTEIYVLNPHPECVPAAFARELERELIEARKAGQWQPIETHSLGQELVLLSDGKNRVAGYYGGANSGWRTSDTASMWPAPTHWMPLPSAPETETPKQNDLRAEIAEAKAFILDCARKYGEIDGREGVTIPPPEFCGESETLKALREAWLEGWRTTYKP